MNCTTVSNENRSFPFFKLLLTAVVVSILLFSVAHALDGHADTLSWVIHEACQNDPKWRGTLPSGRSAIVTEFWRNGQNETGVCFIDPGEEYITSYPRKGTVDQVIEWLKGGGFK